jgi:TPR repeat protein
MRGADWVFVAAVEGLPQAQVCYGRMLLEGTGVSKNPEQALKWFRRAAAADDADGINMVGRCLDSGWGTAEDAAGAAEHFQRAADMGHPWAQYNLGHMYLDGRGARRAIWTPPQIGIGARRRRAIFAASTTGPACC